jgi:hypothetical protein
MTASDGNTRPHWARRWLRSFRILLLLLVLAALAALLYLNQVGLPDLIKHPLLAELRARGLDLNFRRLRLHAYRGIVADDVTLRQAGHAYSPQVQIQEADVNLDLTALADGQWKPTSITLRGGQLRWSVPTTNQPPADVAIDGLVAELAFLPADQWRLDRFQAVWRGIKFRISGTLTNASEVALWSSKPRPSSTALFERIHGIVTYLDQVRLTEPPEVRIVVRADARALNQLRADITVSPTSGRAPFGTAEEAILHARCLPAGMDGQDLSIELGGRASRIGTEWATLRQPRFETRWLLNHTNLLPRHATSRLDVAEAQTRWGKGRQLHLAWTFEPRLESTPSATNPSLANSHFEAAGTALDSPHGTAQRGTLRGDLVHHGLQWPPSSVTTHIELAGIRTTAGEARALRLDAGARPNPDTNAVTQAEASWGFWAPLAPYRVTWDIDAEGPRTPKLAADRLRCAGAWTPPTAEVHNLRLELDGRPLEARLRAHATTRALQVEVDSHIDPHRFNPFLGERARRWLGRYEWTEPPHLVAQAALVWPAWTNRWPDWEREVEPSVVASGSFEVKQGAYRTVRVSSAQGQMRFSNQVLRIDPLHATRPEGAARLRIVHDSRTEEYRIDASGIADLKALTPFYGAANQRVLDPFEFSQPAAVTCTVWGPWDIGKGALAGHVQLTNFTYKSEPIAAIDTTLAYTNGVVDLQNARGWHATGRVAADGLHYEFRNRRLAITNATSTMDPNIVARLIGPDTARTLEPYHFATPPTVQLNGAVTLGKNPDADLRFHVAGGPFRWLVFQLPQIDADLHWRGLFLGISNAAGPCYGGRLQGDGQFDLSPEGSTDFKFRLRATDLDLHAVMSDVSSPTNRLEGALTCDLTVTAANSAALHSSWHGHGGVRLRDGLLWDTPVFGVFSPVLNAVYPGLGNSRAERATATFVITNSVIDTKDLEIHASGMRLDYRGTVDFKTRMNARVELRFLHNTPGVGPLVSLMFAPLTKVFEYKLTGTLASPHKGPLYIPKILLFPLRPISTIRELFSAPKAQEQDRTEPPESSPPPGTTPPSSANPSQPAQRQ